ncbi:competence protein CoiA family protein [Vibrio parahaemolyticus]|uniref:competence protein CoiA family protein n=1 Tax=Vibrio parahaemolyticus TaxID=670 RepID=UPI001E18631F|nr:hypothetical protein [Vibrio parahaemolyticus]EHY0996457.1 hypothetical protein [Vibrio parahaemolyticus]MCR9667031.1 hypothetical protein [Vibrio parahaemolyticus]MCR9823418.1 hypothetical protein [Vibrio parahaemolyticus]
MDTIEKHSLWELEVENFDRVVLASELIDFMSSDTSDSDVSQSLLKSFIAKSFAESGVYAKCSNCGCPVHLIAPNATATDPYFRHVPSRAPSIEKMQQCTFYSNSETFFGKGQIYKGEGKWHFETKHFLAEHLKAIGYKDVYVEKFIFSKEPETDKRRKPDISFIDIDGNRFVIELTRWWMSPEVVYEREKFFRTEGYNLIWLFSPNCEEANPVTLNMILYGSAASREEASADVLSKVECNAFVLSDEAIQRMKVHRNLTFEVMYPVPRYNPTLNIIDIDKHNQWALLEELDLAPEQRLPFAVKTSKAFKDVMYEKRFNERRALAEKIIQLRKLALSEPTLESEVEHDNKMQQVRRISSYKDKVRNARRFMLYEQMATKNIGNAYAKFMASQTRREAAKEIRFVRNAIREHLLDIERIQSESFIQTRYSRIKNLADSAKQYQSLKLISFINRSLAKVENQLQEIKTKRTAVAKVEQEAKQKSRDNHINEREAFIEELRDGFSDIPEDLSVLQMKKDRIVRKAKEYGFLGRADDLERIFNTAVKDAYKAYEQIHYPNLSQGWSHLLRYKTELDAAFNLCEKTLYKRDPQKKRVTSYQQATRAVLSRFRVSMNEHIGRLYQELLYADQPVFSSLLLKHASEVERMRECFVYIQSNGYRGDSTVHMQLDIICESIESFNQGTDLRKVLQFFSEASQRSLDLN